MSTLGNRYFVIFIDDFSRCTWLFLMKSRTKLFSVFQKFFVEIRNQFHTSIRILRSDNALEHLSTPFFDFLSSHGILYQSSCAYTLQKNRVAEHKNRHLVETTRTLLLHHTVPQHFWGDAILTACYLINHMSSFVLGDQVSHSLLFSNQPLFCLPPRVFGCTCFVHILTPGQDKRFAKATKCIFPGYSRLQCGYHCYSLDTHRYFVSADVTSFKHPSIFSTPPPSSSEVLSLPLIFPIPALSFEFLATPPRSLQVCTHCSHSDTKPPDDSSLMAPSFTMPVLPSPIDPPIAIRKDTHSSRNPHPIYTFLVLSSFIFTIFCFFFYFVFCFSS